MTVILGFLLLVEIETIQYIAHMGSCEVDDIIMNTVGTFQGSMAYELAFTLERVKLKYFFGKIRCKR